MDPEDLPPVHEKAPNMGSPEEMKEAARDAPTQDVESMEESLARWSKKVQELEWQLDIMRQQVGFSTESRSQFSRLFIVDKILLNAMEVVLIFPPRFFQKTKEYSFSVKIQSLTKTIKIPPKK